MARGDTVIGVDNLNDYYDVDLKKARLARLKTNTLFRDEFIDITDHKALDGVFDRGTSRSDRAPRGAGGRALLARESAGLHRREHDRLSEHPRVRASPRYRAPRVCVVEFGVRRQHADAVFDRRQRRSSTQLVRRDEKSERTDGAHVQSSVSNTDHRLAILHRVRTVGPPRHGAVPFHALDPRRANRSTSSITAITNATSRTSTTSSKVSFECWIEFRNSIETPTTHPRIHR